MDTPTMSAVDIVLETVAYYSEDPANRRALELTNVSTKSCMYKTAAGNMCALGRCMIDPPLNFLGDLYQLVEESDAFKKGLNEFLNKNPNITDEEQDIFEFELKNNLFQSLLKPEYRGHPMDFWNQLQALHDREEYWAEKGLSDRGIAQRDYIINYYCAS